MDLSIVIPAYNEENRISPTLEQYVDFFRRKYQENFEILVIINGSKDNTLNVVKRISKRYIQVKYIDVKEAIGKGGAIIEGFKLAQGDLIGFVDADNATKARVFNDLVENINDYDGIIASRWIKGAKIANKQPILRRVASRGFNILVRLLFWINIRDTQCGAKLFKKEAIKEVVNNLGITQWAFDIDLLYQLRRKKFKLHEIPTEWDDSTGSTLKITKTVPEMFLAITRLRLIYSPFKFIVDIYERILK